MKSKNLWNPNELKIPKKYEKHGDLILFPIDSFSHKNWVTAGDELWNLICKEYQVTKIAR